MGKVVLFQYFVKEYQAVLDYMEKRGVTFVQAERTLYSMDHTEVGAALAVRWGFPPNLEAAIAYHHNPEPAGDLADFAAVTATANQIAQITEEDTLLANEGYEVAVEVSEGFHPLSEAAYQAVVKELGKQMPFFENFIDRMEAFRRPSPILEEEISRARGESSIWKLPQKESIWKLPEK
jgi:HD-like signal output (HDOD) protein